MNVYASMLYTGLARRTTRFVCLWLAPQEYVNTCSPRRVVRRPQRHSGGGGPALKVATRVAASTPPKHLDIFKGAPLRLPTPCAKSNAPPPAHVLPPGRMDRLGGVSAFAGVETTSFTWGLCQALTNGGSRYQENCETR